MRYVLLTALLLGLLPPATAGAQDETDAIKQVIEPAKPTMNGIWVRNPDLSDDPQKMMARRGAAVGGVGGGMGGGMRGGGMGGRSGMSRGGRGTNTRGSGGAGKMPDGIDDRPPGKRRPNLFRGSDRLEIFHEGEEFSVTDAMDVMQTVYTDGRRTERWTELGQLFDTAVPTKEGLLVRSETPDGQGRTTTYILNDTGEILTVLHTFKPPKSKQAINVKMVYDRVE